MKQSLFIFVLFFSFQLFAQNKVQSICGEYIYYAPTNVSIDEAVKTAIDRARINALADNFGTIVSQNNSTVVKNENGQSTIDFTSLGESEVKGEWVEDTKIPETKVSYEKDLLVIKAKVYGKAREIKCSSVDFTAKILRNGTDVKFESEKFKDGDDFYLLFKSPVNGYLAVYLLDDEQKVFCLLPYKDNPYGQTKVEHGKDYIFFSRKQASLEDFREVEEYKLTAEKAVETNQLILVFSTNEFTKANDNLTSAGMPRVLSFNDFNHWLIKCRNSDTEFQVERKMIEIRK